MSDAGEQPIKVVQSSSFEKTLKQLKHKQHDLVDDEIEKIIKDPTVGEQKKGDLSHLWVHKFRLGGQQVLLGYSWVEDRLEIHLLSLGSHENFYKKAKQRRKADLQLVQK